MSKGKREPAEERKEKAEQERILKEDPLHGAVSCETCLKEIPSSIAHTEEGDGYVLYFCGLECFDKWGHKGDKKKAD